MQESRAIETYLDQINKLNSLNISLEEELMATKIRLRASEDTCLKYQILLKELEKQNEKKNTLQINETGKMNEIIRYKLSQRDRYWSEKVTQLQSQIEKHYQTQVTDLKEQLSQIKRDTQRNSRVQKPMKTDDIDLLNFKCKKLQRDKEHLQETIVNLKISFQNNIEEEIKKAKKIADIQNREKQENERKIYRQKIEQLEISLKKLQAELSEANLKADPERQSEITRLKQELNNLKHANDLQIFKITEHFSVKNHQLEQELEEKSKKQAQLIEQQKDFRKLMKKMEDKLFDKEKKNDEEILQLTEKMSKLRDQQISLLKAQLFTHQEAIIKERNKWDSVIEDKEKQLQRVVKQKNEDVQRFKEQKTELKAKISELKQKINQYQGNRQASENLQLTQSLRELQVREADFASYENSVTFLGRELKKALMRIEQKNLQINRLIKQLNSLRSSNENDLKGLKDKFKKDRANYAMRIQKLLQQIKGLSEKNRIQDKEAKTKLKQCEKQLVIVKTENKSLKDMIDEMQKDYERIQSNKNSVKSEYREERQKVFTSKTDMTLIKQQKWVQFERQRNQLAANFMEKQQQLKIKHELEKNKLKSERDQARCEGEKLKQLLEQLKKKYPSNIFTTKDKENLNAEYEKKVAALDLEIEHTKNIHDALRNAKFRINQTGLESDRNFSKISEQVSESDRELNLEVSAKKRQESPGEQKNKLVFSFNPQQ